jgi:hypothetical protein
MRSSISIVPSLCVQSTRSTPSLICIPHKEGKASVFFGGDRLPDVQNRQSGGWHCDSGTHLAYFWRHKDFQDRFVWLWSEIASHYAGNPWVAGYNVLNEPADPHPTHSGLINLYDRACAAIRQVDSRHILFLDGNTFATDFTKFPEDVQTRWGDNVAFAIHDYSTFGFPKYKGKYESTPEQRKMMEESYRRKRKWLDDRGLCVWNGEWGPVYARAEYDGDATEDINRQRYQVLEDQLQIYKEVGLCFLPRSRYEI